MANLTRTPLFLRALAAICLWATAAVAAPTDVIVYCDDNYPPYSYEVDGESRGIYPRIMTEAFSRMKGYRVTIRPVPWKRGLRHIQSGDGFAIFPPYFRPDERLYIWPYSVPILQEEVVVVCRDEILRRAAGRRWPDDFFGLTIGMNAGFALGGKAFNTAAKEGRITINEAKSNRANILKLGIKRIDCYINDRIAILWELNRLKAEGLYDEGGLHDVLREAVVVSSEWGYLGFTRMDFGRFSFKEDFIRQFNDVIRAMQTSGEIQKIVDQFLASPN